MALINNFGKIHFDFGAVKEIPGVLASLGVKRPLLLSDVGLVACGVFEKVVDVLPNGGTAARYTHIPENPTVPGVEAAMEVYRAEDCDGVIAIGGGSVIDSGKAVSLLAEHPGPLIDYAGHPEKVTAAVVPLIAVPTTAGTGAEVTRGGGIHPDAHSRGFGIGADQLLPKVAICDPDLTLTLPPILTAGTGMDAMGHAIEGFMAPTINPPAEAIALDAIRRVKANVVRATDNGGDKQARWEMLMAALEGGMAISKGLGPAHALSITCGDTGLHHGALVTIAMPAVIRFGAEAAGDKMGRLAHALGLGPDGDAAGEIARLNEALGIPATYRALGYEKQDIDEMAEDAAAHYFNNTAPKRPMVEDYKPMLREVIG